ncbi:hypothetical protein OXPF_16460 [Oxobacter pfennigii]|uniref:Ribosomal RNA large subunit methyltransferase K/L-like methyltransferase domain-containing protein n=1 Tax=Oxobacter pfennigii TaxID=36849 RepID=A0A0P8YXS4_9CLOT|nr:hypothetical protein [Oxobacter pfennigii]KPU44563.1 hypothetical protein OXPF_16460 [Oxobacter pfennigii]
MYLYILSKPSNQEKIAELECLMLTGTKTDKSYAISPNYTDLKRAAYIDFSVDIHAEDYSLNNLYKKIEKLNLSRERFRVRFINVHEHIDFHERKRVEREISDLFLTAPDLKNPLTDFIVTRIDQKWLFGEFVEKSPNRWLIFNKKPHTFCNALPSRMARALVNIAACNSTDIKLVDPCCGVGTVLLEALDMGIDAEGYDINEIVVNNANLNLVHFGFESKVTCLDASHIKGMYDVSVIDLPYGVLSKKGSDKYDSIIGNARDLCKRAVILSSRDIQNIILSCGFKVIEYIILPKGGLDRHIAVCE